MFAALMFGVFKVECSGGDGSTGEPMVNHVRVVIGIIIIL